MSIAKRIEGLIENTKLDLNTQKYQKQYSELLNMGIIQRKSYNLADVNVIGDKLPSSVEKHIITPSFSKID